jgi:hypothetical protein
MSQVIALRLFQRPASPPASRFRCEQWVRTVEPSECGAFSLIVFDALWGIDIPPDLE